MKVLAVVPVKRLEDSKRRLSELLSPAERRVLTLAMLEDVLTALKTSTVNQTVVVSDDEQICAFAKTKNADFLAPSDPALNASLEETADWCKKIGSESMLVLPADVPLASSSDVDAIVRLGAQRVSVVVSPSWNGGTNALFQNPPKLIPACFGAESFRKHINIAQCRGVEFRVYCSAGLMLDVDSAEDLKKSYEAKPQTHCKDALEQFMQSNDRLRKFMQ